MKTSKYISIITAALLISSCGSKTSEPEQEHGHEEASTDEVHLLQKQMDVMDIRLGTFQYLNLSTTVKSNGQLELPPQNKASLSAVMGGRVTDIKVVEGDRVVKGQVLATIEHPDFIEMQRDYMTTKSQLTFLEQEYLRKKSLYADSLTTAKAFQQASAEYQSALGNVSALKAKLQMLSVDVTAVERGEFFSRIPVRSPINGFVRLIEINMGKYVQPEQEMFEIVDNDHIHIDLMVYEKDMDKVKVGQKVIFSLTNRPDSVLEGKIFAVGKSFEQEPKAMVVHAEIDNKQGNLLPGMYVDARIITDEKKVQAVPNDAIVSDGGLSYIYVLKSEAEAGHHHDEEAHHDHAEEEEGHYHAAEEDHEGEFVFRKIEVNTGATDIGFTEVVPAYDLPDDIQLVTKGAFYLLAEMKKGEGGEGHHH